MPLKLRSKPTSKLTEKEYERLMKLSVPGRLMGKSLSTYRDADNSRAVMLINGNGVIQAWSYIHEAQDKKWYIHAFVPKYARGNGHATRLIYHALKMCPETPIAQLGDEGTDAFWSKFDVEFKANG